MKKTPKIFWILFTLILIAAAAPRAVEVLSGNYLFEYDQGLFFEAIKKIVVDRKPTLIGAEVGGQGGFFQGPGWYYLLTIPFAVGRGDPYAAMVLMFFLGLAVVAAAILLGRLMVGWQVALFWGFMLAVSPAIISQSRIIWPPFPVSLISVGLLFSLWQLFHGKARFIFWLGLLVGALFHFEVATGGTLGLQLLFTALPVLLWRRLVSARHLLAGGAALILILSPLLLFDLRHDFIISRGIANFLLKDPPHEITRKYIEAMAANHTAVFLNNFKATFPFGNRLWLMLTVGTGLTFLFYLQDRKVTWGDKAFFVYLVTSPFVLWSIFMLYQWPMWEWWILELPIYYTLLLAAMMRYIWQTRKFRFLVILLLVVFSGGHAQDVVRFYRVDYRDYGGTHKIRGKLAAIDTIYQDAQSEPFNLLVFTPPIYTYDYDYLLWWYGQRHYGYLPGREKKDIFYLLIEPDPHKPWTYKGWLETVVKTGRVVQTWELPSGFIIEKRTTEET